MRIPRALAGFFSAPWRAVSILRAHNAALKEAERVRSSFERGEATYADTEAAHAKTWGPFNEWFDIILPLWGSLTFYAIVLLIVGALLGFN